MNIVLDVLALAIVIGSVYFGVKHGFVKTLMGFVSHIIALAAAFLLASPVGKLVCGNWIGPIFEKNVLRMLDSMASGAVTDAASAPVESLLQSGGKAFSDLLTRFGVASADVQGSMMTGDIAAARESAVQAIYMPAATAVSNVIAFVLVFAAALLIMMLITFVLTQAAKLPLLSGANRLAGFAIGAAKGLLVLCVVCSLIGLAVPYAESLGAFGVKTKDIENSLIFKEVYRWNPLPRFGVLADIPEIEA